MAKKPSIITGFAILFLISFTLIALSIHKIRNKESTAVLISEKNKFKISFNILPKDQNQLDKTLEKLAIPKNIKDGISFELDSTSAAKLTFVSPVIAKINLSPNKIRFEGKLDRPYTLKDLYPHQIKLPNSTNIAIASLSLSEFAKSKLNFPQNLFNWIETNKLSDTNQYFINLKEDTNVFVFQSKSQIEDLKSKEISLKEELVEEMEIFYLTFHNSQDQEEKTLALAKSQDHVFVASSRDELLDLINIQKSPKDELNFPFKSHVQVSYVIYAKNNNDQFIDALTGLVFKSQPQALEFAKNIDSFYLALSKESFSALIKIK